MRQLLRRFNRGEEGAGLVEYALIAALVAICLVGILQLFRNGIGGAVNHAAAGISHRSTASYGAAPRPVVTPPPSSGGVAAPGGPGEESADSSGGRPDEVPDDGR
jgi:Flp pilus assembly pilin Flp